MAQAYAQEPEFSIQEYAATLGNEEIRMIIDIGQGQEVPEDIVLYLTEKAERLGMSYQQLIREVQTAYENR